MVALVFVGAMVVRVKVGCVVDVGFIVCVGKGVCVGKTAVSVDTTSGSVGTIGMLVTSTTCTGFVAGMGVSVPMSWWQEMIRIKSGIKVNRRRIFIDLNNIIKLVIT